MNKYKFHNSQLLYKVELVEVTEQIKKLTYNVIKLSCFPKASSGLLICHREKAALVLLGI